MRIYLNNNPGNFIPNGFETTEPWVFLKTVASTTTTTTRWRTRWVAICGQFLIQSRYVKILHDFIAVLFIKG